MSKDALLKALDPWMKVETWHTAHTLDEQRFHRAIAVACRTSGTALDAAEIEEAIMQLAKKYHGAFEGYHLYDAMDHYAQEAENLSMYVKNTQGDS
ncbi:MULTISPECIES: hypothetical protein [Xanthomonas]|uniref:hypothetical protein n=1 Tax=Xanthomonas TaxID=338 RepID=UPI0004E6786D|nr:MULTISPECIES: hypothetical protein [Xanthomonas]AZR35234.1 hypothetical protein NX08_012930 [Xanthomonas vasicola]OOW84909.1 hypothetical protein Xvtw_13215 [Xanthomonas campestris pv. vitiswoodrowii]PNV30245.1 hypothetical protein xavtCFBP7764_00210 [Xanthomonas citri]WPM78366.1 hypothetical protein XVT_09530 [Xanthomonas citri pv. viticola]